MLNRHILATLPLTSLLLTLAPGCMSGAALEGEGSSGELGSSGEVESSGEVVTDGSGSGVMTTTEDPGLEDVVQVACVPGSTEVCGYGGPAHTLEVGSCRAATRVCDEQGQWGGCAGEVVPRVEDCRTAIDEDCDGRRACSGEVEWVRGFAQPAGGEYGHVSATGLAIDGHERVWLTGELGGSLQIGGSVWDGVEQTMYMARLYRDGTPELGYADVREGACGGGTTIAADGRGLVAVAAMNCGALRLATQAPSRVHTGGFHSAQVGVFAQAGDFVRDLPLRSDGAGGVDVHRLAFDGAGNLWIAGRFFAGAVTVGSGYEARMLGGAGASDGMVVKLRPDGEVAWAHAFGDGHDQQIVGMDVNAAGDVWLAGGMFGSMQFAGGSLHAQTLDADRASMFVVKLNGAGEWLWGRVYDSAANQAFTQVRVDADEAVLAGFYQGTALKLGGEVVVNQVTQAALVVARLDAQGEPLWARGWPCVGACVLDSLVVDGAGQAVASAALQPSSALVIEDVVTWAPAESEAGVIAKLDRDGRLVWAPRWARADMKLAVGPTGAIYMAGSFAGALSFGAEAALNLDAGTDGEDVYVARARP